MKRSLFFVLLAVSAWLTVALTQPEERSATSAQNATLQRSAPPEKLSDWSLFAGEIAQQQPAPGVIPYALNTPLFSDYAEKLRFVRLPAGATVPYSATGVLSFPEGTVIAKTFYYPNDFRDVAKGRRLMETRLLVHDPSGWRALEYVWNDEQTEAFLDVAGDTKTVRYVDADGRKQQHDYVMPNLNQCKGCHNRNEKMTPIGPSVAQLNGEFAYAEGAENQLARWQRSGLLKDAPPPADCPKLPVWNRPETGPLADRARAYLASNCAHCHNPQGPASTSGLNLDYGDVDATLLGIQKTPVAAGRGAGGRLYDIVAGHPEQSILLYRMESLDPGVMMPELGRKRQHREGVALVRAWIESLREN